MHGACRREPTRAKDDAPRADARQVRATDRLPPRKATHASEQPEDQQVHVRSHCSPRQADQGTAEQPADQVRAHCTCTDRQPERAGRGQAKRRHDDQTCRSSSRAVVIQAAGFGDDFARAASTAAFTPRSVGAFPSPLTSQSRETPRTAAREQSVSTRMFPTWPDSISETCPSALSRASRSSSRAEMSASCRTERRRSANGDGSCFSAMPNLLALTNTFGKCNA